MWRSLLFVPILNERLVSGASRRGADAIVLDLEAAVPAERKSEARDALPSSISNLQGAGSDIAVRVNALEDGGQRDIEIALDAGTDLIVIPRATPQNTAAAADLAGNTPTIPLIESPRGVIDALAIAEAPSVAGLGFGVEDYAAEMGAAPTPDLLEHAAFQVIQAARAARRQPLVFADTIAQYSDLARFKTAARKARAMGASGGFAIHPGQVQILNEVFSPTTKEIADAEKIIAAAERARNQGLSVATANGQMIDEPIETRARNILAMQRRSAD